MRYFEKKYGILRFVYINDRKGDKNVSAVFFVMGYF